MNDLKKTILALAPVWLVLVIVFYFAIGWKALWVVSVLFVIAILFIILMSYWFKLIENYFNKKGW